MSGLAILMVSELVPDKRDLNAMKLKTVSYKNAEPISFKAVDAN